MKNAIKYVLLGLVIVAGCKDFEDENLDFSNSLAQYVELSTDDEVEATAGGEVAITVRMREALNIPVTVNYEVAGDFSSSGTTIIEAGDLSTSVTLMVPSDPASGSASITLSGVDNNLSLGRGGPDAGLSPLSRMIVW